MLAQTEVSQQYDLMALKLAAEIHGDQGMNPNDLSRFLVFNLASPTSRSICLLIGEIAQHRFAWNSINLVHTLKLPLS